MQQSGGLEGDVTNTKLDAELLASQKQSGLVMTSAAQVNGHFVRGAMEPDLIFDAVCAGFADQFQPSICATCVGCASGTSKGCVVSGICGGGEENSNEGPSGQNGDDETSQALNDMLAQYLPDFESECGLRLDDLIDSVGGSDPTDQSGDSGDMNDALAGMKILDEAKLSSWCSDGQKDEMRTSLLGFQECTEYELLHLIQDVPVAIVGVALRCINSMTMMDMAAMDINHACGEAILGNHPLGKALREVLVHPDDTIKCYQQLVDTVPECTVDLWPFPVDGKTLKMGACILTQLEEMFTQMCVDGLTSLESCLPANGADIYPSSCSSIAADCSATESLYVTGLMVLPPHLRGSPLPAACASEAEGLGLNSVVDRYETFRSTCASEGSMLWDKLDDPVVNSGDSEGLQTFYKFLRVGSSETVSEPEEGSKPQVEGSGISEELDQEEESIKVTERASGASSFGFGVLGGLIVTCLVYALFVVARNKIRGNPVRWSSFAVGTETYNEVPVESMEFS